MTETRRSPCIRKVDSKADNGRSCGGSRRRAGIAALPDFLTEKELASGALVALMNNSYRSLKAGIFIVRPPGAPPRAKGPVLTELLIEHFG